MNKIYLKDYSESAYFISNVDLNVTLDPSNTVVKSKLIMQRNNKISKTNLVLDGIAIKLQSVKLDGEIINQDNYVVNSENLTINADILKDNFILEIVTTCIPEKNTCLNGLYYSSNLFCTQCESEGFRRITYYLDRPDVLAKFNVTINANKEQFPVLLSNGNLLESGENADGIHWVSWQDPHPKPCYLFALVAGNLAVHEDSFTTCSGRKVALKIYVDPNNIKKTAHAMSALKKSMLWDEKTYGREYDLDLYMIVAVRDFNMGAMENKGLNIFNEKYVLATSELATDTDYNLIDAIIGHEYFHNWSGNRVTCRDWFQLSLKEGFTVFREQQFSEFVSGSSSALIENVKSLRSVQYAEDAGPLAHAVLPESYVSINNFYTSTIYDKGAEVIRMLQGLLGWDVFRKGCDLYFSKYDGMAVTIEDFIAIMERVANKDLTQFKLWYSEIGTPEVTITRKYDSTNSTYTLNFNVTKEMHIPVAIGLLDSEGNDLIDTKIIELKSKQHSVTFDNINSEPVPSYLRNFSAPIIVKHDLTDAELLFLLVNDNNDFARWDASEQYFTRLIKNIISNEGVFNISPEFITALNNLLNSNIEKSLLSIILSVPSDSYIVDNMLQVDPDKIVAAKSYLRKLIAGNLQDILLKTYNDNIITIGYKYNATDVAKRKLKNICLYYLTSINSDLAVKQFNTSDNMTDKLAALNAINNIDCEDRATMLEEFYNQYSSEPLVVTKWQRLHATTTLKNAITKVEELMQHESFKITNPNNVYAVLGGFANGNIANFHDLSGNGYKLLQDVIIQLDSINPQIGARLTESFSKWLRFDPTRQQLIKSTLKFIQQNTKSKDLGEVVTQILG